MTAITWKNRVNGNWNVAANWSTGAVPTSADDVTIAAPGSYTVTISSNRVIIPPLDGLLLTALQLGSADEANSLTFDAEEAALEENAGALVVEGALTVNAGLVSLNEPNTIGSVMLTGGVLAFGARRRARQPCGAADRGHCGRRRTAGHSERDPQQRAHLFGNFDDSRRARNDTQPQPGLPHHRRAFEEPSSRARIRWPIPAPTISSPTTELLARLPPPSSTMACSRRRAAAT